MARWALGAFIAAAFGAAFTGAGVFLIWRTLEYTKSTLVEAKNAVTVTREIGEAQTRAYLSVASATVLFKKYNSAPLVVVTLRNSGNSPAKTVKVSFRAGYFHHTVQRVQDGFTPECITLGIDIAHGETHTFNQFFEDFPIGDAERAAIAESPFVNFEVTIRIEFTDVFGKVIPEELDWCCFIPQEFEKQAVLFRVPFSASHSFVEHKKKKKDGAP